MFYSTSIFLFVYLLKIIRLKFTHSLINFLKSEIKNVGFKFEKKYDSGLLFLMLNSLSIALLVYLDLRVIQFDDTFICVLLEGIFCFYLFLSVILPIVWVIINDKYVIKLKEDFFILFDLQFNIRNKKQYDPELVGIYLTSSRLCTKFNRIGKIVHDDISKFRWLPRKGKMKYDLDLYLRFHEFSVPLNLQKQILNIILALNEWDNIQEIKYNPLNYNNSISFRKRFQKNRIENQLKFLRVLTFSI